MRALLVSMLAVFVAACSSSRVDGVVHTASAPVPDARVLLVCPGAMEPSRGYGQFTKSGPDGRFSLVVEPTSPPSIPMRCELRVFRDGLVTGRWSVKDICAQADGDVCRVARVDALLQPLPEPQ